ncbi:restriction endonuclease subunit S [bacterium]|nr:restriction endonuclease subunit S [bacterium]MBU1633952.1 restriction endonuclease subunit S [bacterium]MBU1875196.1 restriction endonuclease subunit S [bacterium]
MNLLFDHFEKLLDAPNSIKKMRELILQLAVQGKLVPQNPSDEPASELLKKIKAEKQKLIAEGKIQKDKPLPPIRPEEIPYKLPKGWVWCRIPEVTINFGQKKPDKKFTYIDVSSINKERGIISNELDILQPNEAPSRARKIVKSKCIIYSTVRPYLLNIAIIERDFEFEPIVSTAFYVMNPLGGINERYLYFYLRSLIFTNYVESKMIGMAYPAINDSQMRMGIFPIPPIQEQHRIVAKVDQLMALCDELEMLKDKRDRKRLLMNKAALFTLLNSQTPEEFAGHWQRIVDHFTEFYRIPENVAELKKAILLLAVQGRLVPQDPNDKPATELLKKIKAEKQKLIAEGKIKKEKPLPPIQPDEIPYELPKGWVWCRFGNIITLRHGHQFRNYDFVKDGIPVIKITQCKTDGTLDLSNCDYIDRSRNDEFKEYLIQKDDLLMALTGGTLGKITRVKIDYGIVVQNYRVGNFFPLERYLLKDYAEIILKSGLFQDLVVNQINQNAQPNIGKDKINYLLISVPPINEQHCIVTKVDELMRLCDDLEKGLTKSQESLEKVLGSVVNSIR